MRQCGRLPGQLECRPRAWQVAHHGGEGIGSVDAYGVEGIDWQQRSVDFNLAAPVLRSRSTQSRRRELVGTFATLTAAVAAGCQRHH
jgi:hypothetical protein